MKKKIGNKARVEGSICNAYLTEETSNFCTHYFESHVDTKGKKYSCSAYTQDNDPKDKSIPEPFSCNIGYCPSEGTSIFFDEQDYNCAHHYILGNCGILKEYEMYVSILSTLLISTYCTISI